MALIDRILWQIEVHLDRDLDLAELSDRCAVSPYHMSRAFRQSTGLSIMAYVRARRLSVAARTLAGGAEGVIGVALDAGYASHEAFTRAFAARFGVLPSTVRSAGSITDLNLMEPLKMDKKLIVDVAPPEIRTRPAFRVVGPSLRCTFEDNAGILGLWQSFETTTANVESSAPDVAYGVCADADGAGSFRYLAGLAAEARVDGLDAVDLPAARYAVFTHDGHISDLPRTVYTIWNRSLPDHGLDPAGTPDFEVYDRRFDPRTGRGPVEIWIPVMADAA
ncbi:AraC family transcriptional regulator [Jannaschia marina]|uniref:AraC family transcriptional regulator n=1 Tax=Jannaschia marina TaxID=2741674 RepID=UPI0015CDBC99|nr:AraC family transcriptional regulator [Jannaschia marina]